MSAAVNISLAGFDALDALIDKFAGLDTSDLLDSFGAEMESQTHERLQETKQSPDGDDWESWWDSYAQTRHSNHSLLMGEGDLDDSIQYLVESGGVEVGSNVAYAATHQFGDEDRGQVARPYLGVSDDDEVDLVNVAEVWLAKVAGDAL